MNDEQMNELFDKISKLETHVKRTEEFIQTKTLVDEKKIKHKNLIIICMTILLALSMIMNGFTIHELSKYEKVTTTTTEEIYDIDNSKQEINGDGTINNVEGNQYNDNATHNDNTSK